VACSRRDQSAARIHLGDSGTGRDLNHARERGNLGLPPDGCCRDGCSISPRRRTASRQ
jgi:hypothetical protein